MSFKSAASAEFLKVREKARQILAAAEPPLDEVLTVCGWLLESIFAGSEEPREQLLDLVLDLRRQAIRLAQELNPALVQQQLELHLRELEPRVREVQRETPQSPIEWVTALWVLETRLYNLQLVVEAFQRCTPDALLADVMRLEAWIARLVGRTSARLDSLHATENSGIEALEMGRVQTELGHLRFELSRVRNGLVTERTEDALAASGFPALTAQLELLLESAGTRSVLAALHENPDPRAAEVDLQLRQGLESTLTQFDPFTREDAFYRCCRRVGDWSDEVLASTEEQSLEEADSSLTNALNLLDWLSGLGHKLELKERRVLKELRRFARRRRALADQEMEIRLRRRMVQRFGLRGFDRLQHYQVSLLVALIVVVGLDVLLGATGPLRRWLDLVDGGICLLLTGDFLLRARFSLEPVRYLRRHGLLELLPALPFGLVTGLFSGLPGGPWGQVLRWIELIRPALWFTRFGILVLRGIDRLVSRIRIVLQPNIVLFEPPPAKPDPHDLLPAIRRLRAKNLLRTRFACTSVPPASILGLLRPVLAELRCRPEQPVQRLGGPRILPQESFAREIRFETVVDQLEHLRAEEVEDLLGGPNVDRWTWYLRQLNRPILKHIPLLGHLAVQKHEDEPYEAIARAGQAIGRTLGLISSLTHWVADLKGLVTGPALLDRVGFFLVGYTQRPAKRLLMLGIGFILIKLMLDLLFVRISPLENAATALNRILGVGLIAVGTGCLAVMGLGMWLRRIAGEATDVYRNLVEAQHTNLLESHKESTRDRDLDLLERRVLRPEANLRPELPDCIPQGGRLDDLFLPGMLRAGKGPNRVLHDLERVARLYLDFLDGSVLHSSNTKLVEQLLGNLVLTSIRMERLAYKKKELKRLDALDPKGGRALLGPHMWFRLATNSLAEQTAKLILEFNRYCIPLENRGHASPEDLSAMRRWMQRLRGQSSGPARQEVDRERRRVDHFQTLFFNALHFLSDHPRRDAEVAEEFDEEVRLCLRQARKTMIRRIFGSYPLHALPRPARTLNLYGIYRRRLSRGRLLLLPLYVLVLGLAGIPRLIRMIAATVRDILDPSFIPEARLHLDSSLAVAHRKIDRMRRPLFLEMMRLRAEFDPEYLGVLLPGLPPPGAGFGTCAEDLDFLHASTTERAFFTQLRQTRWEEAQRLEAFLFRRGILRRLGPGLFTVAPAVSLDGLRALSIAWLIDYNGFTQLFEKEKQIDAVLTSESLATELKPWSTLFGRLRQQVAGFFRTFGYLRKDPLRQAWNRYEADRGWGTLPESDRGLRALAFRVNHKKIRASILDLLRRNIAGRASAEAERILKETLEHPGLWNTQLLTARTVQVLAVLDLMHLRETIELLGEYTEPVTLAAEVPEFLAPADPLAEDTDPSEAGLSVPPALAADPR